MRRIQLGDEITAATAQAKNLRDGIALQYADMAVIGGNIDRRTFFQTSLAGAAAAAGIPLLSSPPPQEARALKTIRLDPEGITALMGYDAELRGNLRQFPGWPKAVSNWPYTGPPLERDRAKWKQYSDAHWWVEVWESPADSFTWKVDVPRADYYQVYMVGTGRESVIEVAVGDGKITSWVNNGWDVMWDASHFPPLDGKWRVGFAPPMITSVLSGPGGTGCRWTPSTSLPAPVRSRCGPAR